MLVITNNGIEQLFFQLHPSIVKLIQYRDHSPHLPYLAARALRVMMFLMGLLPLVHSITSHMHSWPDHISLR